jgi:hypothetical protein
MNRFQLDKAADARAAQLEANKTVYRNWLAQHPEVADCIANDNMLQEYFAQEDVLTTEKLDYALDKLQKKKSLAIQVPPSKAEIRADLIEQIMQALQRTNNKHWQIPKNVATERTRMKYWTAEQLSARLEEIIRRQTLSALPLWELRKIAHGNPEPPSQWPRLPLRFVPRGQVISVALDADYLNGLPATKEGMYEFDRLTRIYGDDQIDRRRGIKK